MTPLLVASKTRSRTRCSDKQLIFTDGTKTPSPEQATLFENLIVIAFRRNRHNKAQLSTPSTMPPLVLRLLSTLDRDLKGPFMRDRNLQVLYYKNKLFLQTFSYIGRDSSVTVPFCEPIGCELLDKELGRHVLKAFESCLEEKPFPRFKSEWSECMAGLIRETGCKSADSVSRVGFIIDVSEKDGGIQIYFLPARQGNSEFRKSYLSDIVLHCPSESTQISVTLQEVITRLLQVKNI